MDEQESHQPSRRALHSQPMATRRPSTASTSSKKKAPAGKKPTPGKNPSKSASKSAKGRAARASAPAAKPDTGTSKRTSRSAAREAPPKRSARVAAPAETEISPAQESRTLPIEIDPKRIEESFGKLTDELRHWANKGRYTRVRFKFRGKPLLPDLPLAAVVAAEGLSFYWGGILRMLMVHVAGRAVFDVELVNDADRKVQEGKEALLRGDLDAALVALREAIGMDRDHAAAHLQLGVALKLAGEREAAKKALEKAKKLDPKGTVGAEATRLMTSLGPPATLVRIDGP